MTIRGRALKYEADDVNTDVIWPGKYTYVQMEPADMAARAMETFDPDFPARARERSVLVVGKNFGCGSSREQASACLKHAGVAVVVARSFARIFYRNSINLALPVVECPAAVDAIADGDAVAVDLDGGAVTVGERTFPFAPYPEFVLQIVRDGGLIAHIRKADAR